MNRHYFNLEQDVEQPRWSWDHFASWGIDLLTFGELNFQSFANLGPRTPRAMGHGPWAMGHGPWAMGPGPWAMGPGPWAMGPGIQPRILHDSSWKC